MTRYVYDSILFSYKRCVCRFIGERRVTARVAWSAYIRTLLCTGRVGAVASGAIAGRSVMGVAWRGQDVDGIT